MQPADLAITLRRRSPWESMDLGLTMLQRWGRQVYLPHLMIALPITGAALALAWWLERPWVALALVWWLKPVFDRVVLHVLSRAVFGELKDTRTVLAAWKEWLFAGLVPSLLLRLVWFDLNRSFVLPARQLEGQRGRAGRERRSVLGRRTGSYAVWLTLVCFALEVLVLWTSFGLITELFVPAKADEGKSLLHLFVGDVDNPGTLLGWDDAFAYPAAVMLLEPFYVAAGFGLYLSRRTQLEGWDIEVALRRIAQRHVVALLVAVVAILSFAATPGYAQEKDAKTEIRSVLEDKQFGYYKDVKRWERRDRDKKPSDIDTTWLQALGYALAKIGELLLWVGAGAAVAYAIWWIVRKLPLRGPPPREPYQPPAALFGMDLAPEKLPPDVAAAAAALAREGKLREALGLLYRGALSELVHKRGLELLPSHTEGEAVKLAGLPYFSALVDAWQRCAYARRIPLAAEVENLAAGYGRAFA